MTDDQTTPVPRVITGHSGAPGYAVGPAHHWGDDQARRVSTAPSDDPSAQLAAAITAADAHLHAAIATADATAEPLLTAQRLMLDDPELREGALALVQAGIDPREAIVTVAAQLAALLEASESTYFRERAIDVRAAGDLVARMLSGATARNLPPAGAVVIAEELGPLDTAELAGAGIAALVTRRGGSTCHTAIMARAWGIPAVVGAAEARAIPFGAPVLVDGNSGRVIAHPTPAEVAACAPSTAPVVHLARRIPIYANVGSLAEATRAATLGAEGIGLLRTEFLFLDRTVPPSEEKQTEQYAAILRAMSDRPVTIRTLDIGADKPVPFLPIEPEPNPQLGLRGIRLCLQHREVFRTQLRALLRASDAGQLRIMLPMVTTVDEVREARALLADAATDLGRPLPPLGIMIEVPAAALAASELAAVSDFFSLGTNDLLQFLLAADRQHAGVGYLYTADHPGVWRLLETVVAAAHAAGIPVSLCGEWAADPTKLPRLVALGLDALSVSPAALARVQAMCIGADPA